MEGTKRDIKRIVLERSRGWGWDVTVDDRARRELGADEALWLLACALLGRMHPSLLTPEQQKTLYGE